MSKHNVLIIGAGYHSRRIYIPYLLNKENVELKAILDLPAQEGVINTYLRDKGIENIECFFEAKDIVSDSLSKSEEVLLDKIVKKHDIDAVVISTEPLSHFKYAKWALDNSIHILMDKPITTEVDVSIDEKKAKKIFTDYEKLKKLYQNKSKSGSLVFTLQAQRRYHDGYKRVRDLIIEARDRTNCPVTSIESFHSDGMWRLPKEIVEMNYHPYNQGYGKVSHSGYHTVDISLWFAKHGIIDSKKKFNEFSVYSNFLRPVDFFNQITFDDYMAIFPEANTDLFLTEKEIKSKENFYKKHVTGEIDAHTIISLKKDGKTVTQIGSHLIHNGFSQRGWYYSKLKDLYKGNGRLRHESYTIEQGPFQCIIVNAFQSLEIKNELNNAYDVGGEHHFDIHVFRNSTLFKDWQAYELITMEQLMNIEDIGYSRGHQEEARRNCVDEFLDSINKNTPIEKQESNFLQHELSTFIISKIYESSARDYKNKSSVIKGSLPKDIWNS